MKKQGSAKKLRLNRETLTLLELESVGGGSLGDTSLGSCYCTTVVSLRYANQTALCGPTVHTQPLCD